MRSQGCQRRALVPVIFLLSEFRVSVVDVALGRVDAPPEGCRTTRLTSVAMACSGYRTGIV